MKIFVVICCVLALHSSLGTHDLINDDLDRVYSLVQSSLIENGFSEFYANCVTDALRADGAAIKFRATQDNMMTVLQPKIDSVNFICRSKEIFSPVPLEYVLLIFGLLCIMIKIFARFCCAHNLVQLTRNKDVQFQKMDA